MNRGEAGPSFRALGLSGHLGLEKRVIDYGYHRPRARSPNNSAADQSIPIEVQAHSTPSSPD